MTLLSKLNKSERTNLVLAFIFILLISFLAGSYGLTDKNDAANKSVQGAYAETIYLIGTTVPSMPIVLDFKNGGEVSGIYAEKDADIISGQILATLKDYVYPEIIELKKKLEVEKNKLSTLSPKEHEVAIKLAEAKSAADLFDRDKIHFSTKLSEIEKNISKLVINKMSLLFKYDGGAYYLPLESCRSPLKKEIEDDRNNLGDMVTQLQKGVLGLTTLSKNEVLAANINLAHESARQTLDILENLSVLNDHCDLSSHLNTISESLLLSSSIYRETEALNLSLSNKLSELDRLNKELETLREGNGELILDQQNKITELEEKLKKVIEISSGNVILSPVNGRIIKIEIRNGELIPEKYPSITISPSNNFEVHVKAEKDTLSRLKLWMPAIISINDINFPGVVSKIDKDFVIISFKELDSRVKGGAKASVSIRVMK